MYTISYRDSRYNAVRRYPSAYDDSAIHMCRMDLPIIVHRHLHVYTPFRYFKRLPLLAATDSLCHFFAYCVITLVRNTSGSPSMHRQRLRLPYFHKLRGCSCGLHVRTLRFAVRLCPPGFSLVACLGRCCHQLVLREPLLGRAIISCGLLGSSFLLGKVPFCSIRWIRLRLCGFVWSGLLLLGVHNHMHDDPWCLRFLLIISVVLSFTRYCSCSLVLALLDVFSM